MKFKRGLKANLIIIFILIVVLHVSTSFFVVNQELSTNLIEQLAYNDNYYEKFSGEKILLSSTSENLNGNWGCLELKPLLFNHRMILLLIR